jgi:hypothetical protein
LGGRGPLRTLKTAPVLSSEMVSCRAVRGSGRRRLLTFIGHDRSPGHLPGAGADHALWGQTLLTLQSDTHVTAGQTVDPVSPRPSKHDTPSGLATASRRYHRPPAPRRPTCPCSRCQRSAATGPASVGDHDQAACPSNRDHRRSTRPGWAGRSSRRARLRRGGLRGPCAAGRRAGGAP